MGVTAGVGREWVGKGGGLEEGQKGGGGNKGREWKERREEGE